MNLAQKLLVAIEEDAYLLSVLSGKGKKKQPTREEKLLAEALTRMNTTMTSQEKLDLKIQLGIIEKHPLYIEPASSVEESYRYGWNRGLAMKVETVLRGRWFTWLNIIHKGELVSDEKLPPCPMDINYGDTEVSRMLNQCMNHVRAEGHHVDALIDWIGFSLGLSWCERPKISEKLWNKLYQEFDLTLFLLIPGDHLSPFMAEQGNQSGLNGYYPTPVSIATLLNSMLGTTATQSVIEPCLGGGALLLNTNSLAPVGIDLNLLLVKAAAIQAFCYLPQLLYTPIPIIGLHYSREEERINQYFEFKTDTRIYWGDSLIGELQAPKNIFHEDSEWIDIFLNPLDLQKREIYQYEEEMAMPWHVLSREQKFKIVAAQAREIGFDNVASNPPFGALNRYTRQRIEEIRERNKLFLQQRQERLKAKNVTPHPMVEEIQIEVEYKMNEIGQYEIF